MPLGTGGILVLETPATGKKWMSVRSKLWLSQSTLRLCKHVNFGIEHDNAKKGHPWL